MSNEGEDIDMGAEERNVECIDADENVLSRKAGTKDSRVKSGEVTKLKIVPEKEDATQASIKRKKVDEDIKEVVDVAQKIAATLQTKIEEKNSNRAFVYVYSRLQEVSAEDAKNKRKAVLLILED